MSIRNKILLPTIGMILASTIAVLVTAIFIFRSYVDDTTAAQLNAYAKVAQSEFEGLGEKANIYSDLLANDPQIIAAVEDGDRAALAKRAAELQGETDVDFTTILDAAGTVIIRTHEPDNFGDSLAEQDGISAAMAGQQLTTVEQGSAVRLSVRSATPVKNDNGKVIGVVSSGYRLDTNEFVDGVKETVGVEVTVFLGDERVSTTVVKPDGTRAVGTTADPQVSALVLAGNEYQGPVQILGQGADSKYVPLYNHQNEVVGMLFVGQYDTVQTRAIWNFIWQGGLVALVVLGVAIAVVLVVSRRIVKPIKAMVAAADQLAEGEVRLDIPVEGKDETAHLAAAFNRMIAATRAQAETLAAVAAGDLTLAVPVRSEADVMGKALRDMLEKNNSAFTQIRQAADHVTDQSHQLAGASQALAQGATEQASVVQQLSSSISMVHAQAQENAQKAEQAAVLGHSIKQNAEKGSGQMGRMINAVDNITDSSQKIAGVIKVIDDIAFQTNILALNAAVEAARAGQHGKGFAVVADEVRSLAAKSAAAAKDTSLLIEDSMAKAQQGAEIANETSASLHEIVAGIEESEQLVGSIAEGSAEQNDALQQISSGIEQVAIVVQQNTATSEESAASSEELSSQSTLLRQLVAQFRLADEAGTARLPEHKGP